MGVLRSYTWPMFLALSAGLSAISDILQSAPIAYAFASLLLAIATFSIVAFKIPAIESAIRKAFSLEEAFPVVSFGASCAILAVLVFGFATISQRLGKQGGAIASAFPEVAEIQSRIGIVERGVSEIADITRKTSAVTDQIKADTEFLNAASDRWLVIERMDIYGDARGYNFDVSLLNPSSFVFDNVNFIVRDASHRDLVFIKDTDQIVAPSATRFWRPKMKAKPQAIEVCISGKRQSDGVWTKEIRSYREDLQSEIGRHSYKIIEVERPKRIDPDNRCT